MSDILNKPSSVEEYLKAMRELEARVEEQRQERTVMFIDIVGYTAFVDRHGDIAGLRRVETAGETVIPSCELHGGHLVKQIGDEWMFLFVDPIQAAQAAMEVQERIANSQKNDRAPIRLKIGAHYGKLLLHAQDAFGDVVNMASRLVGLCTGDDILISRSVYDEVGPYYQSRCFPLPELRLRGKTDLAEAYGLDWKPCDVAVAEQEPAPKLTLEVRWNGENSSITIQSNTEESAPLVSKEDHRIYEKEIDEVSETLWETVRSANLNASGKRSSTNLEELGKKLFDLLLPPSIRERLREAEEEFLVLDLDESCVHVPWEVIHDGKEFLCCKFSVGRKARTGQKMRGRNRMPPAAHFSMLVVSDPTGDLPAAAQEGMALYDLCQHDSRVRIKLKNGRVTRDKIHDYLPEYDALHYCGHAEHVNNHPDRSGWVLSDGDFKASDLEVFTKEDRPIPRLVFNNACHSGAAGSWREEATGWSYGLANAFMLAGCVHYIGVIAELLDQGSKEFSRLFYREVMAGHPIGRALRKARNEYRKRFGTENLTWVQYVLYGKPEVGLFLLPRRKTPGGGAQQQPPSLRLLIDRSSSVKPSCSVYVWADRDSELENGGEPSHRKSRSGNSKSDHSEARANVIPLFEEDSVPVEEVGGTKSRSFKSVVSEICEDVGIPREDRFVETASGVYRFDLDTPIEADRFAARVARKANGGFKSKQIFVTESAFEELPVGTRALYREEESFEPAFETSSHSVRRRITHKEYEPSPFERAKDWFLEHKAIALSGVAVVFVLFALTFLQLGGEPPLPRGPSGGDDVVEIAGGVEKGLGQLAPSETNQDKVTPEKDKNYYVDKGEERFDKGDLKGALSYFKNALNLDTEDAPLKARIFSLEKGIRDIEKEEKREKELNQGKALLDLARSIPTPPPSAMDRDKWTSGPVAVAIFQIDEPLAPPWGETEINAFRQSLEAAFLEHGRWNLVTRDALDAVLLERGLQASQLTQDSTETYAVAGLVGARALGFVTLEEKDGENQASLRMVDISRTIVALEASGGEGELADLAPILVQQTLPALEKKYRLQSRIEEIEDGVAVLNVGKIHGAVKGLEFDVYPQESDSRAADHLGTLRSIGTLKVTRVEEEASLCEILSGELDLAEGMRAKERVDED